MVRGGPTAKCCSVARERVPPALGRALRSFTHLSLTPILPLLRAIPAPETVSVPSVGRDTATSW